MKIEKAHPDVFPFTSTDFGRRSFDGWINTAELILAKYDNRDDFSNIGAEKLTEKAGPIGFDLSGNELKKAEEQYNELKEEVLEKLKDNLKYSNF